MSVCTHRQERARTPVGPSNGYHDPVKSGKRGRAGPEAKRAGRENGPPAANGEAPGAYSPRASSAGVYFSLSESETAL